MAGQSVFLSYRRADSGRTVERLYDVLATSFGAGSVFRDLEAIAPGTAFDAAVRAAILQCRVCLVVIGPAWLAADEADPRPRLFRAGDPVAMEVETALQSDATVIPLLVDGATMPAADRLPPPLAELSVRNAISLRPEAFHADLSGLLGQIADHDPAALATRVRPAFRDQIVLPESSLEALDQVMRHLRHARALCEQLGDLAEEADAAPTLLVTGPPGCGKSLLARVVSHALGLDLYRIELDDVLLRWQIGDRLPIDWLFRRIGAARVAVQLREGVDVSPEGAATSAMLTKSLLRHLRRRDGLLIVTRNATAADGAAGSNPRNEAFDHRIDIPFPDAAARMTIWKELLRRQPWFADDGLVSLAATPLPGAAIRLAVRQAMVDALDEGATLDLRHLAKAARDQSSSDFR